MTHLLRIVTSAILLLCMFAISESSAQTDCPPIGPLCITQSPTTNPPLLSAYQDPPASNIWYVTLDPHPTQTSTARS
jgi:hypothetical protein